jgi:hypothetical protein
MEATAEMTAAERQLARASFQPPKVKLFTRVMYRNHGQGEPLLAYVTEVGNRTINVLALAPSGFIPRTCVYHHSDPTARSDGMRNYATWEHAPAERGYDELAENLLSVEAKLEEADNRISALELALAELAVPEKKTTTKQK